MADNNNDVINDILNQLDSAKKQQEAEIGPTPQKNTEEKTERAAQPVREEAPAPRPVQRQAERRPRKTADNDHQAAAAPPPARPPRPRVSEEMHTRNSAAVKRNAAHHKKKKKKRRSRLPGVLILTVFIFAVSICLSLVIIAFGKDMFGIGKDDTTKMIIVPENTNTEMISQQLYDEGIINSPKCFQLFSKFRKTPDIYIPGEHFVSPNMAYETIIDTLTNEEEEERKEAVNVTFPEAINLYSAAQLLEEKGVCNASDFMFYFNAGGYGYRFEDKLNKNTNTLRFADTRMEGYLFPDTYTFTKEMDPEQVCQKIYYNFDNKLTDDRIKRMEELHLSLDQLITLASIVQAEAPNREDMNHVASVFWNRLDNPEAETVGKLQSDPTKNYANYTIKPHMTVLNNEILKAYDTYQSTGLPPGAICNPGLDAIDAVLLKMKTDDYYFIANIYTQKTYFAKTNDEHEMNKAMVKADEAQYEAEQAAREAEEAANE
ncbi:endolytic transglycosylase MltG [Ruminococcus flavefaciens]|uniref:endolytic transglycosylase MltG n=1 Tax=Ruminococcus flavefaciens TaxID=1265 RepID=UPI0026EDC7A3|nr:endolytic transglycosylase MltG [Ruminococcus flavefaciens]